MYIFEYASYVGLGHTGKIEAANSPCEHFRIKLCSCTPVGIAHHHNETGCPLYQQVAVRKLHVAAPLPVPGHKFT
jgi:hypothetical protein